MPTDKQQDTSHPGTDDLERERTATRRVVASGMACGVLTRMHHDAGHYRARSEALFRLYVRQRHDPEVDQLFDTARTESRHVLSTLGEAAVGAAIELLEPEIDGAAIAERCVAEEVESGRMAPRSPTTTGGAS